MDPQAESDLLRRNDNLEIINDILIQSTSSLQSSIVDFKRQLHEKLVALDTKHKAGDLRVMASYHSLFLQSIAYWISLLDNKMVPKPILPKPLIKQFDDITKTLVLQANDSNPDSFSMVYEMLFILSTQHPYIFNTSELK